MTDPFQLMVVRQTFIDGVERHPRREALQLTVAEKEAISSHTKVLLGRTVPSVRVKEPALRQILASGRIKNQHETGSSSNPKRDAALERRVWSINGQDPRDHPVHGYLASEHDVQGLALRSVQVAYGSFRMMLDPAVCALSTFTVGDSLWRMEQKMVAPSRMDDPSHLAWPYDLDPFECTNPDEQTFHDVFEIQIFGDVLLGDVRHIVTDHEPPTDLAERATAVGVDLRPSAPGPERWEAYRQDC